MSSVKNDEEFCRFVLYELSKRRAGGEIRKNHSRNFTVW